MKKILSGLILLISISAVNGQGDKILSVKLPKYFTAGTSLSIPVTYNATEERKLHIQIKAPGGKPVYKNVYEVPAGKITTFSAKLTIGEDAPAGRGYLFALFLCKLDEEKIHTSHLDVFRASKQQVVDTKAQTEINRLFETKPGKQVEPTDPKISPNAKKVYDYLQSLRDKKTKKLLTGQYFNTDYETYRDNVEALHALSGRHMAMLHSTYENVELRTHKHMASDFIYPLFYNAWHQGAILQILINPPNPWHGQGRGYIIEGQKEMIPDGHDTEEIFDPKSKAYKTYREILANHADNLEYFRKEDIPIIIRLFGENNGRWFWFQHGSKKMGPENFKRLWKMTVDYFREERGMHNLLFCYEVTDRRDGQLAGLVPSYTDILGVQIGTKFLEGPNELYHRFLPYGKPIILPQLLIGGEAAMKNKTYDTLKLLEAFRKWNPCIVAFTPWNDNLKAGKLFSIVRNENAKKFMEDDYLAHRCDTPFAKRNPPMALPVPKTAEEQTEDIPKGPLSWNFNTPQKRKPFFRAKPWPGMETGTEGLRINPAHRANVLHAAEAEKRLNIIFHGSHVGLINDETLTIDAGKYKHLEIRMRHYSQARDLVVSWNDTGSTAFSGENTATVPIKKFELDYSLYTIDLSGNPTWSGVIRRFQLVFGHNALNGSVEIDYIRFK